jgi:hypothetical protein
MREGRSGRVEEATTEAARAQQRLENAPLPQHGAHAHAHARAHAQTRAHHSLTPCRRGECRTWQTTRAARSRTPGLPQPCSGANKKMLRTHVKGERGTEELELERSIFTAATPPPLPPRRRHRRRATHHRHHRARDHENIQRQLHASDRGRTQSVAKPNVGVVDDESAVAASPRSEDQANIISSEVSVQHQPQSRQTGSGEERDATTPSADKIRTRTRGSS